MGKYIDVEKLIALIDAKLKDLGLSGSVWVGRDVLQDLKNDILTSLQQEQDLIIINKKDWEAQEQFRKNKDFGKPLQHEQQEVGLDADIEMEWDSFNKHLAEYGEESEDVVWLNWNSFDEIARHFYELGLNARKEK